MLLPSLNRGLVEKALREVCVLTLLLGAALLLAEWLLAYVLSSFREEVAGAWGQLAIVKNIF